MSLTAENGTVYCTFRFAYVASTSNQEYRHVSGRYRRGSIQQLLLKCRDGRHIYGEEGHLNKLHGLRSVEQLKIKINLKCPRPGQVRVS